MQIIQDFHLKTISGSSGSDRIHYHQSHGRDQAAFEKYDMLGKVYAIWMFYYIYQMDAFVTGGRFDVDLVLYDNGKKYGYADAKIKPWIDNFTFDTLWIPGRYERYLKYEQEENKPVLFTLFNPDGTICFMTRAAYLLDLKKQDIKSPRPGFKTEPTYLVPMEKVRVFPVERTNPYYPENQSVKENKPCPNSTHDQWVDWINAISDYKPSSKK